MHDERQTRRRLDLTGSDRVAARRTPTVMLLALAFAVTIGDYVEGMVLPAIPAIQKDFDTTPTLVSWVTSILLVVGTASTPLFGKLGDVSGKKHMILVALGIYTVGLAIAGIAPSIYVLLVARAMQATGLVLGPLALAMVTDIFPKEKLASAQSVIGGVIAISSTAGYVLGSLVIQHLGWRDGFFTVLVPSLLAFCLCAKVLAEGPVAKDVRVDYRGGSALGGSMLLILVYLTEGSSIGWASVESIGFLLPGLVLLAAFFALENRTTSPLIEMSLLRVRNFLVANLIRMIGGVVSFLFYYGAVYYAEYPKPYGLGLDILSTGLVLAPATLSVIAWALLGGKLIPKVGPKPMMIIIGALGLVLGLSMCILQRSSPLYLALDGVVVFFGEITTLMPSVNMASIALPKDQVSIGMGVNSMLANLGQSFGPIIATTLLVSFTEPTIKTVNGETLVGQIASPLAFNLIFGAGILFTFLIIIVSLFGKNHTFPQTEGK